MNKSVVLLFGTVFSGNQARENGGAVYALNSAVYIRGILGVNTFTNNSAQKYGGAMECVNCYMRITANLTFATDPESSGGTNLSNTTVLFSNNFAITEDGGAIHFQGESTSLELNAMNIEFTDNVAGYHGGAIAVFLCNTILFNGDNIRFKGNRAGRYGGAIRLDHCDTIINATNLELNDNRAKEAGGALYVGGAKNLIGTKVVRFRHNAASFFGGAVAINRNAFVAMSGEFTNNSAEDGGAIHVGFYKGNRNGRGSLRLFSTIVVGNSGSAISLTDKASAIII